MIDVLPSIFKKTRKERKREREREAQPSTLFTTRGYEKNTINYILQ